MRLEVASCRPSMWDCFHPWRATRATQDHALCICPGPGAGAFFGAYVRP